MDKSLCDKRKFRCFYTPPFVAAEGSGSIMVKCPIDMSGFKKNQQTSRCFHLNYMVQDSFTPIFLPSIPSGVNGILKACLCICGDLQRGMGRWTIVLRGHKPPSTGRLSMQVVEALAY